MDLLSINDKPGAYPPSFYAANIEEIPGTTAPKGQLRCDVCVVGGGFTGLSTALHLAQRGYSVRLLEAQRIGFGASGRNGGQVGQGQRLDQDTLEEMMGKAAARALWDIATQSVELVRDLAESDLVRADFHEGVAHADHRARYAPHSRAYAEKLNTDYDYPHISFLDREAFRELVNSPVYHGGTLDTRAGHIDPLQLALGLARMAQAAGAILHERARVTKVSPGAPARVETEDAVIEAEYVVLACNGYLGDLDRDVSRHVMPINNFIVATEPLDAATRAALLPRNIAVADSKFVVNYFRFSDDNRLLFGGTESYRYRYPSDIAAQVRAPMEEIFPQIKGTPITHAWGGTLAVTMNRMPYFRRDAGNILTMSGFSGHGVAMGTLSGQIAAEAIAGQAERFDAMAALPMRAFPGGPGMRHPLLVLAMLWYSLRDRF